MKAIFYARVSRTDLHTENQEAILKEWAEKHKDELEKSLFLKEEVSTRKTRPVKQEALTLFRRGEYDTIIVVKIDRWARSMLELVQDVQYLIENGGRFISIDNGFDFSKKLSASQQLQFQIFAAFAEFEREIIRERTFEGLARARAQGKKLGRPAKGREYKSITAEQILPYNSPEYSIRQIARLLETSRWRVMQAFKLLEQKGVVIKVVD